MTHILRQLLCCSILATPFLQAEIEISHIAPPTAQQHYFLVMKGAYEQTRGDYVQAAHTFVSLAPYIKSPQMRLAALQVAFEQKRYHDLIKAANEIRTLHADNKELQLKLAQAYLHTHQLQDAATLLLALRAQFPHDDRIAYFAATTLLKQGLTAQAEEIITTVLRQESHAAKHYLFHFLRAKNAFLSGAYDTALEHVKKCTSTHPSFSRVQVLKGLIHEKKGDKEAALASYTEYLAHTPDNDIAQKQLMLAFECGNFLLVQNELKKKPKNEASYFHDLALVTFKLGDYDEAHALLDKALTLSPRFTKARTLRVHLLEAEKKHDEIAALFTKWLHETPHDHNLIRTIMKLEAKGLSREQVCSILRDVADRLEAPLVCFALGDLFHETGDYHEARHYYAQAPRQSATHFQDACMYFKENNHEAMQRELHAAQQYDVIYPSVYNLAAFANPGAPEALQLIEKALAADATNAAYLDTKRVVALSRDPSR